MFGLYKLNIHFRFGQRSLTTLPHCQRDFKGSAVKNSYAGKLQGYWDAIRQTMGNINLGKSTVGSCEGDRMEWQSQKLNCFSKLQISTFSVSYYGRWKNTNGARRSSGKLIFIFRGARGAGADGLRAAPLTSAVCQQVNKLQYGPPLTSRLKRCRRKKNNKKFTKAAPPCSSGKESLTSF